MSLLTSSGIVTGDHIQVTPLEDLVGGNADFGVIRGTALTDLQYGGSARFTVQVLVGMKPCHVLHLNCNEVNVRLLFSASVARES